MLSLSLRSSWYRTSLCMLLSSSIAFAPVRVAQAQSFNAPNLIGGLLAVRSGAAAAALLGIGPSALAGVGLALGAFYIYDRYIDPENTGGVTEKPIAQVNLDNASRILTDIEKAAGFTNEPSLGQTVTPPTKSTAYPPLWTSGGSLDGYPYNIRNVYCSQALNVRQATADGENAYITTQLSPSQVRVPGYNAPAQIGDCVHEATGDTYRILAYNGGPCALGYSGPQCILTNPDIIRLPVDGVCQILRSGNSYGIDNRDPDCTPVAGKPNPLPAFTGTGKGTLSFVSKPDATGRPTVATIDSENGNTRITVANPNILDKERYTTYIVGTSAPDPTTGKTVITTVTNTNTIGVGSTATPASSPAAGTSTGDIKLDLPPNLAKTEDVRAVKDAVDALTVVPDTPYTPDPKSGMDQALAGADEVANAVGKGTLPSIFSFAPPLPSTSAIPQFTFTLAGKTMALDISIWVGYLRTFLGLFLYTMMPFAVYNILTGRREEGV